MPTYPTLPPAVTQALDRGQLVEAIKLLRASGMEPTALKEAVDGYMRTERPRFETRAEGSHAREQVMQQINHPADTLRGLSPGQMPESRFGLWWLGAIVVAVLAAWILSGCASAPGAPVVDLAPSGKSRPAISFGNPILASRGASGEACCASRPSGAHCARFASTG